MHELACQVRKEAECFFDCCNCGKLDACERLFHKKISWLRLREDAPLQLPLFCPM